jgi:hypothetical protein
MRATTLTLAAAACLAIVGPAGAQTSATQGRWRVAVSPYLLVPNMSGTTGIGDLTTQVDAAPDDIFSRLQFGAMLLLEAHNGTWGVALDGIYMDLEQSGTAGPLSATVGMQQGAIELTGFRRLTGWAELLVGGRWNILATEIATEGVQARARSVDEDWIDPFIGARLRAPNTGKWNLEFRGDIGGFGVGSDLAWQVYPKAGYRFSNLFELQAAYRVIGMDYTGGGDPAFVYDMRTFGPELGVVLHF